MSEIITIEREFAADIERVFAAFITPQDLVRWHFASDDWSTPYAEVNPVPGGTFKIGYADSTGEVVFDLIGTYTSVERPTLLAYTLDDGRKVSVQFERAGATKTKVTQSFEAETVNTIELQRGGWSAQLMHLDAYLNKEAV